MGLIITKSKEFAVRTFHYKPIGINQNKQKSAGVASLRVILHLELQLHRQNLSVARASVVPSIVVGIELLIGSCILPNYPPRMG